MTPVRAREIETVVTQKQIEAWVDGYLTAWANLWTVTFDRHGRCAMFRMWNSQVPETT